MRNIDINLKLSMIRVFGFLAVYGSGYLTLAISGIGSIHLSRRTGIHITFRTTSGIEGIKLFRKVAVTRERGKFVTSSKFIVSPTFGKSSRAANLLNRTN